MTQTLLYFTYYGVMCVALTPNLLMAAVASNSLYLTMNLFSGFVIPAPVSHLPPSPLLWPCRCILLLVFDHVLVDCMLLCCHLCCGIFTLLLLLHVTAVLLLRLLLLLSCFTSSCVSASNSCEQLFLFLLHDLTVHRTLCCVWTWNLVLPRPSVPDHPGCHELKTAFVCQSLSLPLCDQTSSNAAGGRSYSSSTCTFNQHLHKRRLTDSAQGSHLKPARL